MFANGMIKIVVTKNNLIRNNEKMLKFAMRTMFATVNIFVNAATIFWLNAVKY